MRCRRRRMDGWMNLKRANSCRRPGERIYRAVVLSGDTQWWLGLGTWDDLVTFGGYEECFSCLVGWSQCMLASSSSSHRPRGQLGRAARRRMTWCVQGVAGYCSASYFCAFNLQSAWYPDCRIEVPMTGCREMVYLLNNEGPSVLAGNLAIWSFCSYNYIISRLWRSTVNDGTKSRNNTRRDTIAKISALWVLDEMLAVMRHRWHCLEDCSTLCDQQ